MRTDHSRTRRMAATGAALLLTCTLALTACGRNDAGTDHGEAVDVDDAAATGTVEIWAAGGDGDELPEMFALFEEQNPDVEVKMTKVPEDEFVAKMTAAVAAGTTPDLVYLFTEFQPTLLATGGFSPVPDGLVEESDFFDSAWQSSIVDDVQYGVPWYTYARAFQFRADLAADAGIDPPADWDDLDDFYAAMQDNGISTPASLYVTPFDAYSAMQFDMFAHQNDGGLISDDLSEWTINSPENVEALEFYGSLFEKGYASPDGPTTADSVGFIASGRTAGLYNGPWFRGWLEDTDGAEWVDDHMGLIVPPAGPNGTQAAMVGGGNWAVPVDAKNPQSAWKFVRFMSEPEQQVTWFTVFGNLPAVESAWDDPAIADNSIMDAIRESIAVGVTIPKVATWSEVGEAIGQQLERVARGQATAQEALDEAQKQAETIGLGD